MNLFSKNSRLLSPSSYQKCSKFKMSTIKYLKPSRMASAKNVSVIMACPPIWKILPGSIDSTKLKDSKDIPGDNLWQKLGWVPPIIYGKTFGLGTYIVTLPENIDQETEKQFSENVFQKVMKNSTDRFLFHCIDDLGFSLFRHFNHFHGSERIYGCVLHEVNGFLTMPYLLLNFSKLFKKSSVNQLTIDNWATNYLKKVEKADYPLYILSHISSPSFGPLVKFKEEQNKYRCVVQESLSRKESVQEIVKTIAKGMDEVIFQGKVDNKIKKKKDIPPFIG